MAVLLYIGVLYPVYFSNNLSLRSINILAFSNWFIAALISFPTGLFQAATYVPGSIQCGSQHCSPVVGFINFTLVSIYFFLTILILSFVFIRLSFYIHQSKKFGSYASSQTLHHARIRLGWTLTAITVISLAEGIPSAFLIGLQADSVLNTCNNFYQADRLVKVTIFTSISSIVWALVLSLDPVASIFFDERILNKVKKHVNRSKLYYAKFLNSVSSSSESPL
ncbi:hypothetical protein CAEBREN_21425 [Caenorhabditis brenneri]|uniref:G-protein coupled receptors family 1 profile domain-containing protein n=1 Tax=Caenorhabditis brenneri TaxID=135651 RepID=G0MPE7_CAEBE|nr:hypothetical protein CAEBREN_21425 [Caenorhabditis brenneri]